MALVRIFFRSVRFALKGIATASQERSFRIQLAVALIVCALGFFFQISRTDWIIILMCIGGVLGMETMNSAIEGVVDLVSPQHQPLAGKVKDLAAGAVLILSFIAAIIGVIVFSNYVIIFFTH